MRSRINRDRFYAQFRTYFKRHRGRGLGEQEINALNRLLDQVVADAEWWKNVRLAPKLLANFFAQVCHESAWTFEPVREGLASRTRNPKLYATQHRYWPSHRYDSKDCYGRGLIQITWRANYDNADRRLGLNGLLINDPNRALDPVISYWIAARGMREGWYTGHKLSDYINERETDYRNARRIVNGTDRAEEIAQASIAWELMLRNSIEQYEDQASRIRRTGEQIAGRIESTSAPVGEGIQLDGGTYAPDSQPLPPLADRNLAEPSGEQTGGGDSPSPSLPAMPQAGGSASHPPAPPASATPADVVVAATAPAKERSNKSLGAIIAAALAAVGLPPALIEVIGGLFADGNIKGAIIIVGILGAVVFIYWKYMDRQTKLDELDRQHAQELNLAKMKYAADQNSNTVDITPNVTPAMPDQAERASNGRS